MMQRLFVDTSAWCALYDRSDQHYPEAKHLFEELKTKPSQLITSEYVLDETYTLLRARAGYKVAVGFGSRIASSKIQVVEVTKEIRDEAWEIFVKYDDKEFSYTDCTSFEIMKELKVRITFCFDHNFTQFGFIVKP